MHRTLRRSLEYEAVLKTVAEKEGKQMSEIGSLEGPRCREIVKQLVRKSDSLLFELHVQCTRRPAPAGSAAAGNTLPQEEQLENAYVCRDLF